MSQHQPANRSALLPAWPVAPTSTAALPSQAWRRPPGYPMVGVDGHRQRVQQPPLWGSLRSSVTNPIFTVAAIAQIPLWYGLVYALAVFSGPAWPMALPLVALVVLTSQSRIALEATDWGLTQRRPQHWMVAWRDVDRIEIKPGGVGKIWGQEHPIVVVYDQGRGQLRGLNKRRNPEYLTSRLHLRQVDALLAMAAHKGVIVSMPTELTGPINPTPPELEAGPSVP